MLVRLRLAAGPMAVLGYGRPALNRWVPYGVAVWPNNVMMFTPFDVSNE